MNRPELNIVKIGGNVINDPTELNRFIDHFAKLPAPKILVHGGGREATDIAAGLGIETKMIDGRRVTDDEMLKIVTMTYAGLINKRIVAALQSRQCDAIGLSGADGNLIKATKRSAQPVDFGYVGDVAEQGVNSLLLSSLLHGGLTPTVCAITHDGQGQLLNTNADSVASILAIAMARRGYDVKLTFCFEMPGVLADINDESTIIPRITEADFKDLTEAGIVKGGMIPKITNALKSVRAGVSKVIIKHHYDLLEPYSGTTITTK